jgi:CheY-like chemotaxis protein
MNIIPQNDQEYKALIMIVDDNPEFVKGIELTLEMEGYQVITAANGQLALDRIQAAFLGRGEEEVSIERLPDLILADIMMPVMDGYTLYERLRISPYTNHIPFIFITAKTAEEDVRHGKELGADDYLAKPFSPEDLISTVRGKLRRVRQRRILKTSLPQNSTTPRSGMLILVGVVSVLIIAAFILGIVVGQIW